MAKASRKEADGRRMYYTMRRGNAPLEWTKEQLYQALKDMGCVWLGLGKGWVERKSWSYQGDLIFYADSVEEAEVALDMLRTYAARLGVKWIHENELEAN
jgi:hypothetical protein